VLFRSDDSDKAALAHVLAATRALQGQCAESSMKGMLSILMLINDASAADDVDMEGDPGDVARSRIGKFMHCASRSQELLTLASASLDVLRTELERGLPLVNHWDRVAADMRKNLDGFRGAALAAALKNTKLDDKGAN
jgi:hypothetical protein